MTSIPLLSIKAEPIAVCRDLNIWQVRAPLEEALVGVPLNAYIERLYNQWIVEWLKKVDQPTIVTIARIPVRAPHTMAGPA